MRFHVLFWAVVVLLRAAGASFAAQTVHLFLEGETQGWIQGDSTQVSMGRENSIEALAFTHMLAAEPDPETGMAGRVRNHFPVTILKRLDRSTPRLMRAWRDREVCSASFKFFRPSPTGDGTTQQFYTIELRGAVISGIRREVLNTLDPVTAGYPPVERVSFTYERISETWMDSGVGAQDEWHANTTRIPLSDVNFDGLVNMKDFVIMADDWLTQF